MINDKKLPQGAYYGELTNITIAKKNSHLPYVLLEFSITGKTKESVKIILKSTKRKIGIKGWTV